jgi:hypothetical protein
MSGRACKACTHERRSDIDEAIIRGDALVDIVVRFDGVSESGLKRHKVNCIFAMIQRAKTRLPEKRQVDLFAAAVRVMQEAGRIGEKAEGKGNLTVAVNALDRYLRGAEFAAKVQEKADGSDFTRDPKWLERVRQLWSILERYPDAHMAVMQEWGQQPQLVEVVEDRGDSETSGK